MKGTYRSVLGSLLLFGGITLAISIVGAAASTSTDSWEQGGVQLENALQAGQPRDFYAKKLTELGYQITAMNYDEPDYVEYEVVKEDQTYEIQIELNTEANATTNVTVTSNTWQTNATERALARHRRSVEATEQGSTQATGETTQPAYRSSDRDQATAEQMLKELEALPEGKDKQFYRDTLKELGYQITQTNTDTAEKLEIEALKNNRSLALSITFDEQAGKSSKVDASTLWWESAATR